MSPTAPTIVTLNDQLNKAHRRIRELQARLRHQSCSDVKYGMSEHANDSPGYCSDAITDTPDARGTPPPHPTRAGPHQIQPLAVCLTWIRSGRYSLSSPAL